MNKLVENIRNLVAWIMLAVFSPVVLCVCLLGNNMRYADLNKLSVLADAPILFLLALICLAVYLFLLWHCKNVKLQGMKVNIIVDVIIALLFFGLYFINVRITREIAFKLPWDIMIVGGAGYTCGNDLPMGEQLYFSLYPNNIPIVYILGRLYHWASETGKYPFMPEQIWMQVNCVFVSVGGYFSCLTVKRLTKNLLTTFGTFVLYNFLIGASPWKMAPYTDMYGIVFPIASIFFYICYRESSTKWQKYVFLFLSLLNASLGGGIKPSIYVILIAVIGVEFLRLLKSFRENCRYFLFLFLLTGLLIWATGFCRDKIR